MQRIVLVFVLGVFLIFQNDAVCQSGPSPHGMPPRGESSTPPEVQTLKSSERQISLEALVQTIPEMKSALSQLDSQYQAYECEKLIVPGLLCSPCQDVIKTGYEKCTYCGTSDREKCLADLRQAAKDSLYYWYGSNIDCSPATEGTCSCPDKSTRKCKLYLIEGAAVGYVVYRKDMFGQDCYAAFRKYDYYCPAGAD